MDDSHGRIKARENEKYLVPVSKLQTLVDVSNLLQDFQKHYITIKPKDGVDCGPQVLRDAGLIKCLDQVGIKIKDEGDITYQCKTSCNPVSNMNNYDHITSMAHEVSKKQECLKKQKQQVLVLGGDHSISIGSFHGIAKNEPFSLIWFDAHGDVNTNISSSSGNVHGMPIALLSKEVFQYFPTLPNMEWFCPVISLKHLGYIGIRDLDPYEKEVISTCSIPSYTPADVKCKGIEKCMCELLQKIDPEGNRSLYVSFDIDGLDPCYTASTGTPVKDGIQLQDALRMLTIIKNTGRFRGMDLTEFNPKIGTEEQVKQSIASIMEVLKAAFSTKKC